MTALAAGCAAGLAAALLVPARPVVATAPDAATGAGRRRAAWLAVVVAVIVGVGAGMVPGLLAAWAGIAAMVAAMLAAQVRGRARRAARTRLRREVAERTEHLAAEMRAGIPTQRAVQAVARDWPVLAGVSEAMRIGAAVPPAFLAAAGRDGAGDLRLVAAAWQVAGATGQSLVEVLDAVADVIRTRDRARAVVDGELAAARATAQTVAVLPVLALAVGAGMGADPFGFLVTTPVGLVCLAAGVLLVWAGIGWIDRIADGVDR